MSKKLNVGTHDLPVSARLSKFMKGGWAETEHKGLLPHASTPWAAARRARISEQYDGTRLIIPAGVLKIRANDSDYRFRPHSAFAWLTGIPGNEAVSDTVLVLEPIQGGHEAQLYLHPRSPRDTDEFFRDRRFGEFWVGRSPTTGEAHARYGLAIRHIDELPALLADRTPSLVVRGQDPKIDALLPSNENESDFLSVLSAARLIKDEYELAELQAAVDATILGFEDAVKSFPAATKEARGERIVEGAFYSRARLEGNDLGYDTIAASGAHACVLHWIRNDGEVNDGDLLLLDAGVEMESLYTSDVTRTLPVNGKFTEAQRKIYLLVYEAQQAALATIKPGAKFRDFHRAAQEVIAKGLAEWGILPITAEESMDPESGLHRRWTLCSTGHMLGLDVHDCGKSVV